MLDNVEQVFLYNILVNRAVGNTQNIFLSQTQFTHKYEIKNGDYCFDWK